MRLKKKASGKKDPCIDLENSNPYFLFLQQRGVAHGEKETYRRLGSPYNVLRTSRNANACRCPGYV
jgi:hypothetical protein